MESEKVVKRHFSKRSAARGAKHNEMTCDEARRSSEVLVQGNKVNTRPSLLSATDE